MLKLTYYYSFYAILPGSLQARASVTLASPTGWIHIVVNYYGTSGSETIVVYINGSEVARETPTSTQNFGPGDGKIVLGRYYSNSDQKYQNVQIDELIYFNQALTLDQIKHLGK